MVKPEARGRMRRVVLISAHVRSGRAIHDAVIHNLSEAGCAFSPPCGDRNSRLEILVEDCEPISAVLVWRDADRAGCRFSKPLSKQAMEMLSRLALASRSLRRGSDCGSTVPTAHPAPPQAKHAA